jgi:hypothetical protein
MLKNKPYIVEIVGEDPSDRVRIVISGDTPHSEVKHRARMMLSRVREDMVEGRVTFEIAQVE